MGFRKILKNKKLICKKNGHKWFARTIRHGGSTGRYYRMQCSVCGETEKVPIYKQ